MVFAEDIQLKILLQLSLAIFLGGLLGLEREYMRKEAGLRTHALVSLGAALFSIVSTNAFTEYIGVQGVSFDPSRIVGQIVLGVGFLGAGVIIYRESHVAGLTTAAGVWVAAGIGVAVGVEMYFVALFTTFLAVFVLAAFRLVEERLFGHKAEEET